MNFLRMSAWTAAGVVTLLMAVTSAGTATAEPTSLAANSATYQDSTGENPAAPDIGTVVVSNDDAGLLSFAIGFTNRAVLGPTELVGVWLDSDANPVTGDPPIGTEHFIQYWGGRSSLWRFDTGSQRWVIAPMVTLRTEWVANRLTIFVNASELGGTAGFRFGVVSDANPDDPNAPLDLAPDGMPLWAYEVKLAPVLSIGPLQVAPRPVVTGKAMVARATVAVVRGGRPEPLAPTATVDWTARIGTLQLEPASTTVEAGDTLVATWQVPRATSARSIQITLAVTMEGVTATATREVEVLYVAPALRVTALDCTPEPAVAGRKMVGKARVVMTRGGAPEALPPTAKARWQATIGNVRLKPTATKVAANGVLLSTWALPRATDEKTVRISLTVTAEGVSVTKSHVHRVR